MKAFTNRYVLSFFPEVGNRCCTAYIVGKVTPNLRSIKGNTMAKVLTDF